MGFFDKLFGGKSKDENTAKFTNQSKTVLTPLQGKVLAQADIPDETFAQGILGPGCGIEPTGDTVYAPFDGTVTQIATTLHAVGITSNDGIELLIHVGMDTVDMKGQGFTVLVKENQKVTAGTPLLKVDLDAKVEDITVGMQQRVEILKMLYRDNEILIFDEPTAVLTPQEIDELMDTMREFAKEGKSILFISHKLNVIMSVADRVTVLRKGKYIGTVETKDTDKQSLSNMMVGRPVQLEVVKAPAQPKETVLHVEGLTIASRGHHKRNAVDGVSFDVRAGEIVCVAGIDGNGPTELIYGLTGLEKTKSGTVTLCGQDISHASIRQRSRYLSHIPEDRHKHGLILDFTLEQNMVLQRYREPQFQHMGFIKDGAVRTYAKKLIEQYDVRSGQGPITIARSMSGGNQQKAIIAREIDRALPLIVAVQPTRGLDVGAIEYIHKQLVAERDKGKAVLLVSLELDEVMSLADRILVMYEGEIVGELDPKTTTVQELGLYMAGAKRTAKEGETA